MRIVNAITVSIVGIAVAVGVSNVPFTWPALAIGAGACATAGLLLVGRRSGQKRYAGAGALYCLGFAAAIHYSGYVPAEYAQSPLTALTGFGALSAAIVGGTEAATLVAKRIGGEYVGRIVGAVSAALGLLGMVWTVLTAYEKAIRYGTVGVGGTGALVLNLIGAELEIPVWFLTEGVDAVILVFVGSVLVGFHTLESLHRGWRATKLTAKKGAEAGKAGASAARGAVSSSQEDS